VLRYVIKRLLWTIALLFAICFVTFLLFNVVPGDPAELAAGRSATPADVERVRHSLGLDRPLVVQFGDFLWRLVGHKSLGRSFVTQENVNDVVARAAPVTASVVFGGMALLLLISIPLGILSAVKSGHGADHAATVLVLVGLALPIAWVGLGLKYFVGFKLGWTPIGRYCELINPSSEECGGAADWAKHLILPWITLALVHSAVYVRFLRSSMLENLDADYVRTARAKGAPESRVIRGHVLRNSLLPIVTMLGMDIGHLLGGAVIVESVFGLPGLGNLAVEAFGNKDAVLARGLILFGATTILVFNLLVDLLYPVLDPRISLET
jgi:peptide/nickel transport system permease protein